MVDVFVVEFYGVFGDAKFFHYLFGFLSGKVKVENLSLGGGEGRKREGEIFGEFFFVRRGLGKVWNIRSGSFGGFQQRFFLFFFLEEKVDSEKEELAYDIGDGKTFKIDFNKLFKKPDADIDENRTGKY